VAHEEWVAMLAAAFVFGATGYGDAVADAYVAANAAAAEVDAAAWRAARLTWPNNIPLGRPSSSRR